MHAENGLAPVDWVSVAAQLRAGIAAGLVFVTSDADGLTGSIGLDVSRHWYGPAPFLTDKWTFVAPRARRTRAVFRLFDAAESKAAALGLPLLLGVMSPVDTERKLSLYRRRFKQVGGIFARG